MPGLLRLLCPRTSLRRRYSLFWLDPLDQTVDGALVIDTGLRQFLSVAVNDFAIEYQLHLEHKSRVLRTVKSTHSKDRK